VSNAGLLGHPRQFAPSAVEPYHSLKMKTKNPRRLEQQAARGRTLVLGHSARSIWRPMASEGTKPVARRDGNQVLTL
jgi:hypothetical protein